VSPATATTTTRHGRVDRESRELKSCIAQIDARVATLPGGGMATDRRYEVAELGVATMTVTTH